jgi:hypothetical protein
MATKDELDQMIGAAGSYTALRGGNEMQPYICAPQPRIDKEIKGLNDGKQ